MTFLIYIDQLENKIWRKVEINDEKPIAYLAYLALATFNSLKKSYYKIEDEDYRYDSMMKPIILDGKEYKDARILKLRDVKLYDNKVFTMNYNYSSQFIIKIRYLGCEEREIDYFDFYPKIVDGVGKAILDGLNIDDLKWIVADTDLHGFSTHKFPKIYEINSVFDYREYDHNLDNMFIKDMLIMIKNKYELDS